jgi:hypothetical protein
MSDTVNLTGTQIGVAREGENIVIFIPDRLYLTIDEQCAVELAVAIYAKATRMPAEEVELFFGRFSEPPKH